ncbi:MAG: putative quinol monooxygenase [Acidimicrobiia bacterium]
MGKEVSWLLELSIKPGELDTGKALMAEMVDATRANEPGTLAYEWSMDDAGTTCHIYERYADSAATMAHMGSFGSKFADRFMAVFAPTGMTVYGEPDDEVRKALSAMGAVFMPPVGGFTR